METKTTDEKKADILREFEKNPYNPESKRPEDLARIFYMNDISILPVVSKRGVLLGILTKDRVVSELSDIERSNSQKIDQFITKLARKLSLDDLLKLVGNVKEFTVINLFGEIFGKWSRLELFSACEQNRGEKYYKNEVDRQKEEQILEWMIYLILEHIPRALYAVNEKGKTIFYNSNFEEIFKNRVGRDVDIKFIEKSLRDPNTNTHYYRKKDSKVLYFFNRDLKLYYEKIPLVSSGRKVGFLIYCDNNLNENSDLSISGNNMEGLSLKEMLESIERLLIVDTIRENEYDISNIAKKLKISKKALLNKIEKHGIDIGDLDKGQAR